MSNYFDRFDTDAKANYFDKFDGEKKKTKAESSIGQDLINALSGAVRGAGSIGSTILLPADMINQKLRGDDFWSMKDNIQRRKDIDAGMRDVFGANTDSGLYQTGKIGAEIAGTMGAGGAIAQGIGRAVPSLANAPIIQSIATSGMGAGGLGTRIAGGAVAGGAGGAMVDPSEAGASAMFGGAMPLLGASASYAKNMFVPSNTKLAKYIASVAGAKTPEELRSFAAALNPEGPELIPNLKRTIPQIVQTPRMSQLNRSMRNISPILAETDAVQNQAYVDALNKISAQSGTVQQAADNAGNAIGDFAKAERAKLSREISEKFEGVDPFGQSKFYLPIDKLQAAKTQFLGDGAYRPAKEVNMALAEANRIGVENLDAVKPASSKALQDLVMAVRAEGGINVSSKSGLQLHGEIRNLREAGLNNLVKKSGKSVERLAEKMHQQGFIPDEDPTTLLNALQDAANGAKFYGNGNAEDVYRRAMEEAQGALPQSESVMKPVDYRTMQNYRSSLNESFKEATAKGRNKEAATLGKMISEIDNHVENVAIGRGAEGEYFAPDMVSTWRDAIKSHAQKMDRFETGPQIGMFRKGADNISSIHSGEIPPKFFSSRGSQSSDIESFKRLAGGNTDLENAMKNYAIADLMNQTTASKMLSSNKVENWVNGRSGAISGLFNPNEQATINAVRVGLNDGFNANNLGRAVGSNTVQNGADLMGLLGNRSLEMLSDYVPFGKTLLKSAQGHQADKMSGLLANPAQVSQEILDLLDGSKRGILNAAQKERLLMLYKTNPALIASLSGNN